jgi:hypothetical protein
MPGVDKAGWRVKLTCVDGRKDWQIKQCQLRSRLGDLPAEATRKASRPEKTDSLCEEESGFGTAKAVIASGVVTVHAATPSAPSQERWLGHNQGHGPFYFYRLNYPQSDLVRVAIWLCPEELCLPEARE